MCCGRSQTGISSGQKGVVGSFAVNPRAGAPGQIPAPAKVTSLFEYVGDSLNPALAWKSTRVTVPGLPSCQTLLA